MSDYDDNLRQALKESVEDLERIAESPTEIVTVVEVVGDYVRASGARGSYSLKRPRVKLEEGEPILVNTESRQFIERSPFKHEPGTFAHVDDLFEGMAVITVAGKEQLVPVLPSVTITRGDRVRLDEHQSIVLGVVIPPEAPPHELGVSWDDVGGQELAKEELRAAIENPWRYPELHSHYDAATSAGILLFGPPGCGKTMLGKAAASSIGSGDGFIYCAGPAVLNEYVGIAERTVRNLFTQARRYHQRTGRKAIIFVDEAEAILGDRNARTAHMERTIVPTFLTEMDGLNESSAIVILATNRSMNLDSAVVRDGRIDSKIFVPRPDQSAAQDVFVRYLSKSPLLGDVNELASKAVTALWNVSFMNSNREHQASNFVTGAMIKNVVEKAKAQAMKRDRASNQLTGVCISDLGHGLAHVIEGLTSIKLDEHYQE